MRSKMSATVQGALAYLKQAPGIDKASLVFVALSFIMLLGLEFHSGWLVRLGQTLVFAPFPNPYTNVRATPPSSERGLAVGCETVKDGFQWYGYDYWFRNRFPGPHQRGVYFLMIIRYVYGHLSGPSPSKGSSWRDRMYQNAIKSAFCRGGPFGRDLGCSPEISSVSMRLRNQNGQQSSLWEVPCR